MSDALGTTSIHVRRARQGDAGSIEWIIERFTPALLVTAERRMGPHLRRLQDPEDAVNELWMAALPRLGELDGRDDRYTPVLLRYLATSLASRINNLARAAARGPMRTEGAGEAVLGELAATTTGVVARVSNGEDYRRLRGALAELPEIDREIVILRGLEQGSNSDVARRLGIEPGTAAVRFHRALKRLKRRLVGTLFDDLDSDLPRVG